MNTLCKRLPIELVHIILSYEGTIIRERRGKYMKQISKMDERYVLLLKNPIKNLFFDCKFGTYTYTPLDI